MIFAKRIESFKIISLLEQEIKKDILNAFPNFNFDVYIFVTSFRCYLFRKKYDKILIFKMGDRFYHRYYDNHGIDDKTFRTYDDIKWCIIYEIILHYAIDYEFKNRKKNDDAEHTFSVIRSKKLEYAKLISVEAYNRMKRNTDSLNA